MRTTIEPSLLSKNSADDSKDELIKTNEQSLIYIGLLGASGSGKSSCINALVGYNNLLPVNKSKVCFP